MFFVFCLIANFAKQKNKTKNKQEKYKQTLCSCVVPVTCFFVCLHGKVDNVTLFFYEYGSYKGSKYRTNLIKT